MVKNHIEAYLALVEKHPHLVENSENGIQVITDPEVLYQQQEELYRQADQAGTPRHWVDLGLIAEDRWVVVLRDLVKFGTNYSGYIRMLNRNSQVEQSGRDVVILVRLNGKYLLQKHFRHEDRRWHWECPRGFGEEKMSGEENASKEVMEETGLRVVSMRRLNKEDERIGFYLADCEGSLKQQDLSEAITQYKMVDTATLKEMVTNSTIDDPYTIRAIAMALL